MSTLNQPHQPFAALFLEPARLHRISAIALPIIAGAIATNLMTFIDTAMVGQLGNAALGGVGIAGQLFFLCLSIALGLAAGVQAMIARRVGENRVERTGNILNAGIILACAVGTALMGVGYALLPALFTLLNSDPEVVREGVAYLMTRLPSVLFIAINIAFRAYWVGMSLAKWSMVSIVSLSLANVLFNYALIFGHWGAPRLEVAGAGLGSTLAVLVGLAINLGLAMRFARPNGFLTRLPDTASVQTILKISYPESVRQCMFSVGVVLMYILIGHIGTRELAAFHVVISICLIAYLPHIGIGGAATTLISETLGKAQTAHAKMWGWQISNLGLIVLLMPALGIVLFPAEILGLFLTDPQTLILATLPLQVAVIAHVLDGYTNIVGGALIGAGATRSAMRLTLLPQWLLTLPILVATILLSGTLIHAMTGLLIATAVSALCGALIWHRARWAHIKL